MVVCSYQKEQAVGLVGTRRRDIHKLSVSILVRAHAREQKVYGSRYPHYIGSVLCVIPIFGLPTKRFSQNLGIKLLAKRAVKLT